MRPRLLELNLGDEEAWEIGLTCGGTIEVFVEPLALDRRRRARHRALRARARARRARRARRRRDAASTATAGKLLVLDDGTVEGTLGDAFLDERFTAEARAALATGSSRTLVLESVRAFVEVFAPPALLLVVGASHVAMPLTTLGARARLPHGRARRPAALRHPRALPGRGRAARSASPPSWSASIRSSPSTALVLVAHDYKYDLPVLRHALGDRRRLHRHARLDAPGRRHPEAAARRRASDEASLGARARADRPRPRRPQRAARSRWRSWPRSRPCAAAAPACR